MAGPTTGTSSYPTLTFKIAQVKKICEQWSHRGSQSHSDVKTQLLIVLSTEGNHTN